MSVLTVVILAMCVWMSSARYNHLRWSDCGSDSSISLQKLEVTPMPITIPGPMTISVAGNLTRSLPTDIQLRVSVKRNTFLLDIPLPCIQHIGSCNYDVSCAAAANHSLLDRMITENWAGVMATIGKQIETYLSQMPQRNTTECPVQPTAVNLQDFTLNLPALPGILSFLSAGDYSAQVTAVDKSSGRTLLCLKLHLTLQQKAAACTGFFCG